MKNIKEIRDLLIKKDNLILADNLDLHIKSITYNSKEVDKGSLFFCKGKNFSKEYLIEAISNGAIAYISEIDYQVDIPKIIVKDIRLAMLDSARYFYGYPDKKIKLIGVTGTKGKSTTCGILKSILDEELKKEGKKPAGIISSIKTYDGKEEYDSKLTTPEAIPFYKNIHNAVVSGLEYMIVEISSQALKYNRVTNAEFDISAFLNISEDHIGPLEHPNFEDYFKSKCKIIEISEGLIYSKDMLKNKEIEKCLHELNKTGISFSLNNKEANYYSRNLKYEEGYTKFTLNKDNINYKLLIMGSYNVENALAAIAISNFFNLSPSSIKKGLEKFVIEGRTNILKSDDERIVAIVDYAHNKLSFEKSYEMFQENFPDYKIVSIFGATGDKAINRRYDLGQVSAKYSDEVYIVPDDPGSEKISEINKVIMEELDKKKVNYKEFTSREDAIRYGFSKVEEKTLFFIAGKGDEKYQLINNKYIEIVDDVEVTLDEIKKYNNIKK